MGLRLELLNVMIHYAERNDAIFLGDEQKGSDVAALRDSR